MIGAYIPENCENLTVGNNDMDSDTAPAIQPPAIDVESRWAD